MLFTLLELNFDQLDEMVWHSGGVEGTLAQDLIISRIAALWALDVFRLGCGGQLLLAFDSQSSLENRNDEEKMGVGLDISANF